MTLRLVLAAAVIAVVIGLTVGVMSAIRQYTLFDYGSTFLAFLFFAMHVFWFAVLLKEFGAIRHSRCEAISFGHWTGVRCRPPGSIVIVDCLIAACICWEAAIGVA